MRSIMRLRSAIFAFTILSSLSLTSHAQKPALTQNIDEKGRIPFHVSLFQTCVGGISCLATSNLPIPQGHRFVITYISALTQCVAGRACYAQLFDGDNDATYQQLLFPQSIGGGMYGFSTPVTYYVEAGSYVYVNFTGFPPDSSVNAYIDGYLVDLTQ